MPFTIRFRVGARNDVDGDRAGSFLVNLPKLTQFQTTSFPEKKRRGRLNWIQNPDKALYCLQAVTLDYWFRYCL